MSFNVQPISSMPLPQPLEATRFSPASLQLAMALKPSLAAEAAGRTMLGSASYSLNPLKPKLNPLNNPSMSLTGVKAHTDAEIRQVSQKFEAVFIRMMFKQMRDTVQKSPLFGNSQAMEFFETMQDEEMANHLASAGGIGIGNVIYQKLKQVTAPHLKTFS